MKTITVRQPWAWAIMSGGKDVENRSRNIVGDHRGRVAIHAGLGWSIEGAHSPEIAAAYYDYRAQTGWAVVNRADAERSLILDGMPRQTVNASQFGVVLGTVEIVSVHHDSDHGRNEADRCSRWAMNNHWHIRLADPLIFDEPIPAVGRLGLWDWNEDVA